MYLMATFIYNLSSNIYLKMLIFGNMTEKRIFAERTMKILIIGLVTRKILKNHDQYKICPKMQDDLLGVHKHLKFENDLLNWAFLLMGQAYLSLTNKEGNILK